MSWPTSGRSGIVHYLIAWRETRGLEAPRVLVGCGAEVLPVFSTGELVSLISDLHGRIGEILPNPFRRPSMAKVRWRPW